MKQIQDVLFAFQDMKFKEFNSKLMPTLDPAIVIGVRTPDLRKYAKELTGTKEAEAFLQELPHTYYEENQLHAFLITEMKDYAHCIQELERFLPYVDNWSTCDGKPPQVLKQHLPELLEKIKEWIQSEHPYTVRYAIVSLMRCYLDDTFSLAYPDMVAAIHSDEYYVKMAVAWYFATALAKQYDAILPYIEEKRLDRWTHNKAIQKAVESYRITTEQKIYLKTLKIK